MHYLKTITLLTNLFFITSCSISKYVAPPFTDLDKILNVKPGLSVQQVNETLKIKPYDIVFSQDQARTILIYNYRVKDRRMSLQTRAANQVLHSEAAQREGEVWYNKNYRELYVLFQNDKVKGVYGEDALTVGGQVESMDAYLNRLQQGEKVANVPEALGFDADLNFVRNTYGQRNRAKSGELSEDAGAKKKQKWLIWGGAAGAAWLISLITK